MFCNRPSRLLFFNSYFPFYLLISILYSFPLSSFFLSLLFFFRWTFLCPSLFTSFTHLCPIFFFLSFFTFFRSHTSHFLSFFFLLSSYPYFFSFTSFYSINFARNRDFINCFLFCFILFILFWSCFIFYGIRKKRFLYASAYITPHLSSWLSSPNHRPVSWKLRSIMTFCTQFSPFSCSSCRLNLLFS